MYLHMCRYLCIHMHNYVQFSNFKDLSMVNRGTPIKHMHGVLNCNFYYRKYYVIRI